MAFLPERRRYSLHREGEVSRSTLALPDEEGSVVPLFVEHLLGFGPRDLPEEPPAGGREKKKEGRGVNRMKAEHGVVILFCLMSSE